MHRNQRPLRCGHVEAVDNIASKGHARGLTMNTSIKRDETIKAPVCTTECPIYRHST